MVLLRGVCSQHTAIAMERHGMTQQKSCVTSQSCSTFRTFLSSKLVRVIIDVLNIGEAVTVQVRAGPMGSRMLRLPYFKTIGTWRW